MLVEAGVAPVCGAVLPGGPVTTDSRCQALGWTIFSSEDGSSLHLDHEPALTAEERRQPEIVCDPLRIQLLCKIDHAVKTASGR
jgi:hypothetical protein